MFNSTLAVAERPAEVARLAGPQIMLAADAECVGVHVAELSRVPTTMEAFQ